jgi:hypothetical protein
LRQHGNIRERARALFAHYVRRAIRLAVTQHDGVRAARCAYEHVVNCALDFLINHGGLGVESDDALWRVIRVAVWPRTGSDPQPERSRALASCHTGVLHNIGGDEATALLRLLRPTLGSADFVALWNATRGPATTDVVADELSHAQLERALQQWAMQMPALRGFADHTATLVA